MSTQLRKTDAGRRPYRLTADQLERMLEAGIIPQGDDLELIGGVLYKMVKKEPHNFAVARSPRHCGVSCPPVSTFVRRSPSARTSGACPSPTS